MNNRISDQSMDRNRGNKEERENSRRKKGEEVISNWESGFGVEKK